MNTIFALIMTFTIDGNVYQEIPATFYTMEDCQQFKTDNRLPEIFQCEQIQGDK